jgi:hypothetical protein
LGGRCLVGGRIPATITTGDAGQQQVSYRSRATYGYSMQIEHNSSLSPQSDSWRISPWLMVLAVLVIAIMTRFYGFEKAVADGFDDWTYLEAARNWAVGSIHTEQAAAKPGFVLLATLAVKMAGYAETTLPLLNSSLDCVNVLLVIAISRLAGLTVPLACLAGLFYALLPASILAARSGLTHTASITCLLAAILLVFRACMKTDQLRTFYACVFFGGLFCMYSGFVHPTTLPFTAYIFICLAVLLLINKNYTHFVFSIGIFTLGASLPLLFFTYFCTGHGIIEKLQSLIYNILDHGKDSDVAVNFGSFYLRRFSHFLFTIFLPRFFPSLFGVYIFTIIAGAIGLLFYMRSIKLNFISTLQVLLIDNIFNAFIFFLTTIQFIALVVTLNHSPNFITSERLFLPILPLAVIGLSTLQASILQLITYKHLQRTVIASVLITCFVSYFISFPFYIYTNPTFFNSLAELIKKDSLKVSPEKKILTIYSNWSYPVTHAYESLDDCFVSYDLKKGDAADVDALHTYIKSNKVKYVLYSPIFYGFPSDDETGDFKSNIMDTNNLKQIIETASFIDLYIKTFHPASVSCHECNQDIMKQPLKFVSSVSASNIDMLSHIVLRSGRNNSFCLYEVSSN